MDDIVKAALRKWPNVPACRGWLALDARGNWFLRDEQAQAAGAFPHSKGSRIEHDKLREFIARNYAHDGEGAWYFQNGPQRVYVELEAAPFVWRIAAHDFALTSHTGLAAALHGAWLDDDGRVFLDTDLGFGLVHTQDMADAARAIEGGLWRPTTLAFAAMPQRFGYLLSPQQTLGQVGP